jgi:hypothetical protein
MISSILGTWKLSHCKLFNAAGTELFDPFHDASGLIIYDKNGLMAVQMMSSGHADSIKGNIFKAPLELFKQSFENYIAYYGSYTINEKERIVTHNVSGSLWPNMVGTTLSRRFEFKDENTLVLSTVEPEAIATAEPIMRYLTWLRT